MKPVQLIAAQASATGIRSEVYHVHNTIAEIVYTGSLIVQLANDPSTANNDVNVRAGIRTRDSEEFVFDDDWQVANALGNWFNNTLWTNAIDGIPLAPQMCIMSGAISGGTNVINAWLLVP